MKKKLLSAVVALSILGSVSFASAGTVTTKGDTNISIGGFTEMYFDWTNNQSFLGTVANPEFSKAKQPSQPAQTSFGSTANHSRLDFALDNKAEGVKGLIEGDFWGSGANESTDQNGNFRLRHAYFVKEFCQEGCKYTPWLLVGQTITLGFYDSYTLNGVYDIAGSSSGPTNRIPQVDFGVKFDLGSVKLNPQIAAEDLLTAYISKSTDFNGSRSTMPGLGVRLPIEFNTGLGAPAKFYADLQWQNLKLTSNANNIDSSNQNSYEFGGGFELPVYFLSFKADTHYSKGFTNYDSLTPNVAPPSYYLNNKSVEKVSATAWDAMLKIDFNKLAKIPFTLAVGYSQVVFGNFGSLSSGTTAYARKASVIFANVAYNLTKSATLGLEYDRNKTYYIGANNDPNDGRVSNQVFFVGMYKF
jgi:hypothetical protein